MTTSTTFRSTILASACIVAAMAAAGCGTAGERDARDTAPAATPGPTAGVAYEPAYPPEVSAEELTQQDVSQQGTPHSHDGGEPHAHDEGEENGEGDDDHGHPH